MCSQLDLFSLASVDSNGGLSGQGLDRPSGKSSETRTASQCSPSTGQELQSSMTSAPSAVTISRRSTSSAVDSLARGTPPQARDLALLILEAASGTNSLALLESCARGGSSSRMLPPVLAAGSMPSEETWNGKVMSRFRSLCRRVMSGRRTFAKGSSWSHGEYPTLSAAEYGSSQNGSNSDRPSAGTPSLHTWAKEQWPTVTASDAADSRRHGYTLTGHPGTTLLDAVLSRQDPSTPQDGPRGAAPAVLSHQFCIALMGFPEYWL